MRYVDDGLLKIENVEVCYDGLNNPELGGYYNRGNFSLEEVLRFKSEHYPHLIAAIPNSETGMNVQKSPPIQKGDTVPPEKRRKEAEITTVIKYTLNKYAKENIDSCETLGAFLEYLKNNIKEIANKDRDKYLAELVDKVGSTSDNCIMLHKPRAIKGEGKNKAWYNRKYIEKRFNEMK